jgi:DNA-binding GntR family transcriptional regulator
VAGGNGETLTSTGATAGARDAGALIRRWRGSGNRAQQIAADLAAKIDAGRLHRWQELPSRAALATEYDVSESTIGIVKKLLADHDFLIIENRRYYIA